MPTSASTERTLFNEAYDRIGEYVTDDSRIPYFNPSDSGVDILPGEPVLIKFGAANAEEVCLAVDIIRPGKIGMLVRYFTVDIACDFSANVILGDEVMWDIDNSVVSLAADVTNGFTIGNITYGISSKSSEMEDPTVDGNDRVICATDSSTKCRVISHAAGKASTTKGTVTILGTVDEEEV